MARIPREIVDAVRERTDIAEVVGRHVTLSRRGRNLVGLCPFHQEKTPSFNVIPDKGIFHCFGCQTGGDAFKFLMLLEGLSFVEAVKELAGPAGVTIEERELTPAERKALRQRATLFDVLEAAGRFYDGCLWTRDEGAPARAYLERRHLGIELARKAGLGWAPGGWTRLVDHLHRDGFSPDQLIEAGVARRNDSGRFYDTLRERVVIPIRDERGRTIAFGGRLLEGDGPKYLNTPETRLYQKSKVLYGLDLARGAIQQRGRVLVVEGYFDVLSLHQAGFGETVATCGTALTPDHLERIRRMARDVLLLMDADEAGLRAAERTLPLFVSAGIQPWRVSLPGAKDPDELVRESGPEALEAALEALEPRFEWVVQRKLDAYGTSTMSAERVLEEVLPLLAALPDAELPSLVANRLKIHDESVRERVRLARSRPAEEPGPPPPPEPEGWRPHRDVSHLLWLLVHRYDQVADVIGRADPELLAGHPPVRPVVARLLSGEPVAAILPELADEGVRRRLSAVVARSRLYEAEDAGQAAIDILVRLARPLRMAKLAAVTRDIERLASGGDPGEMRQRVAQKQAMVKAQRDLEAALRQGDVDVVLSLLV